VGEGASVGLGVIVGEGGNEVTVGGGTVATGAQAINSRNKRKIDFFMPTSNYSITNYFIIKILRLLHIPPKLRPRGNDLPIQACGLLPQASCLIDLL